MARAGSGRSSGRPSGIHTSGRPGSNHNSNPRARGSGSGSCSRSGSGGKMPDVELRPPVRPMPFPPPHPPRNEEPYRRAPECSEKEYQKIMRELRSEETQKKQQQFAMECRLAAEEKQKKDDYYSCRAGTNLVEFLHDIGYFVVWAFIIALIILLFLAGISSAVGVPASTVDREPINTGAPFQTDCIIDELGWFEDVEGTAEALRDFYNATGIQPYIYLRAYDENLKTDEAKMEFADLWYEQNITNEGTFLFLYFAEKNQDSDVGVMCYVDGKLTAPVMDDEAGEIFFAYIDQYWYTDISTDELFITVFDETANRIMEKTESSWAWTAFVWVAAIGLALVLIYGAICLVVSCVKEKRLQEKEENDEVERILNTPMEQLVKDELLERYTEGEEVTP